MFILKNLDLPAVERVVFQSRLGKGSFGEVFEGIAILKDGSGKSAKVAIKVGSAPDIAKRPKPLQSLIDPLIGTCFLGHSGSVA